ncbi:AAA family ATPase [uncultured Methanobrevibacter sp.]|uniref:AAA family ATPase n=1 Tax=uncultured Methanobrevibacter sp. TaxID=253161 RepID=UPI0025FC2FF7|nr:AAA family ATPase [uncultured Methanobrevibacter sp.]
MDEYNFEWVNFYMEFADKLLEYKNKRSELINIIVQSFDEIDMNLPKVEADEYGNKIIPIDIDPFTIFAFFNRGIKDENRIKITSKFKEKFSMKSKIPSTFDGIPVVNNMRTAFYNFQYDGRGNEDIDNLWHIFEYALKLNDNNQNKTEFIKYYNQVLTQRGVGWNITMGLFWIRPKNFIALDQNNRNYLIKSNLFSEKLVNPIKSLRKPPEGELYLKICEEILITNPDIEFKSIPELSINAYFYNHSTEDEKENEGIGDTDINTKKYWLYSPGAQAIHWDEFYEKGIMAIGWDKSGNLKNYKNKKEIGKWLNIYNNDNIRHFNDANTLWQFAQEIQIGDIIFIKKGKYNILGMGIVSSDYIFDEERSYYKHVRKVDWKFKGNWEYDKSNPFIIKTLTEITSYKEMVETINSFFINEENMDLIEEENEFPEYTVEDFLEEAYIDEKEYNVLVSLLKNKKNLIIQGAPGVGKTFIAKRLAYSIMGVKDITRVQMVQFHQSYSYEDFIMGFRPSKENFKLKKGSFYKFCKEAEEDDENDYFFIIDEINRGNLSKIFGELFMLIEKDKRGEKNKIQLLYSDESFFIPKNIYIIGLMNTADRSLAMVDYALRRRFAFYDLKPGFASDGFKNYQENVDIENFNKLIDTVVELNEEIINDESLGEGFVIGHSYFSNIKSYQQLEFIIDYEIIPLLKEYWFDEAEKVENWTLRLKDVIN